jgi:hypothetical protein
MAFLPFLPLVDLFGHSLANSVNALAIVIVLGGIADAVVRKIACRRARAAGALPSQTPTDRRRYRICLACTIAAAVTLALSPFLLGLRVRLSEPALLKAVAEFQATGRGTPYPRWIGCFRFQVVRVYPSGSILFQTHRGFPSRYSADVAGIMYSSGGVPIGRIPISWTRRAEWFEQPL